MTDIRPAVPDRLSSALANRYRVERELGQGGMAARVKESGSANLILLQNWLAALSTPQPR